MYLFVFDGVTPKDSGTKLNDIVIDCVKDDKIARELIGGKKEYVTHDDIAIKFKKCYYIKLNSVF